VTPIRSDVSTGDIVELYAGGLSAAAIGRQLSVDRGVILSRLREQGIHIRPNAGRFGSGKQNSRYKHGHGTVRSREYFSWMSMMRRCENPNSAEYPYYGGRGITVCERWRGDQGFENFLTDMGPRPDGKTLDRYPNNDTGNYEPTNCRWATKREQQLNRRKGIKWPKAASRHHGVYPAKKYLNCAQRWMAQTNKVYIGTFSTEEDAANARDAYVVKHKLNLPLNFPNIRESMKKFAAAQQSVADVAEVAV